jgi:hypothetical protein
VTIHHSETYRDYAIFVGELAPRTFEITVRNLSGDKLATDELQGRVDSNISLRYESLEEALDATSQVRHAIDALLAFGKPE